MTNLYLRLLLQSCTQEKIRKFINWFDFSPILMLSDLLEKGNTKTTQNIIKFLRGNFLLYRKELCSQGIFILKIFVVTTSYSRIFIYFQKLAILLYLSNILIYVNYMDILIVVWNNTDYSFYIKWTGTGRICQIMNLFLLS